MTTRLLSFTASNWGCDGTNCCKGCGSQEQFYGCSDVSISTSGSHYSNSQPITSSSNFGASSSVFGIGSSQSGSSPIGMFSSVDSGHSGESASVIGIGAPQSGSSQLGTYQGQRSKCQATQFARSKYAFADQWCQTQCKLGNCPTNYCEVACRSISG